MRQALSRRSFDERSKLPSGSLTEFELKQTLSLYIPRQAIFIKISSTSLVPSSGVACSSFAVNIFHFMILIFVREHFIGMDLNGQLVLVTDFFHRSKRIFITTIFLIFPKIIFPTFAQAVRYVQDHDV